MLTKNKKIFILITLIFLLLFNTKVNADEFNITANEVIIDKENEILVGKGDVEAVDTEGRIIKADKIT